MIQRWEIYNWCTNQRVQLCSSKEVATRLIPFHDKYHIVREIFFYNDGQRAPIFVSKFGERIPTKQKRKNE